MQTKAEPTGPSRQRFHAALLEYSRSPGKYPVALRQPPLLFASIREILQLAADREAEAGLATDDALRESACFFTRTALFYPGADHYALLGLERKVDGAELKDRYRLLMRLIHPDLSRPGSGLWPADAAVRVNLAHEVLSSPVQRREYDGLLAAASEMPSASKVQHRRINKPARTAGSGMSQSGFKKLIVVCSVAGGFLVLIGLFMGGGDGVHLVQRGTQTADPVVAAVQEPVLPAVISIAPPTQTSRVQNVPAQQQPAAPAPKPATPSAVPAAPPAPVIVTAPQVRTAPKAIEAAPPEPAPVARIARSEPATSIPSPGPTPEVQVPPPAPVVIAVAAPVPPQPPRPAPVAVPAPPPPARPGPVAGLSLAEAQPLLSNLLQHLESGQGERLINMLDRAARNKPGAQALSRHYDRLVDGMKPVRLSHVEFKAEPADGRLVVTGNIRLQVGEQTIGSLGKLMVLRAEFASRDGAVVMTGLSGLPGN
jgi:hypothetical protein